MTSDSDVDWPDPKDHEFSLVGLAGQMALLDAAITAVKQTLNNAAVENTHNEHFFCGDAERRSCQEPNVTE